MSKLNSEICFIVPCYNEENNINYTLDEINKVIKKLNVKYYEIIVVDDGSIDNTYLKVKKTNFLKKFKLKRNLGIGGAYKYGLGKSNSKYVIMIPGDNSHPASSIQPILEIMGKKDIIIPFTLKKGKRSFFRYCLSNIFTLVVNFIFDMNIKYYNGTVLHKRDLLKKLKINSNGFDYQAEILIKLIKQGHTYEFIKVEINEREIGTSKAVSINNVFKIIKNLIQIKKNLQKS